MERITNFSFSFAGKSSNGMGIKIMSMPIRSIAQVRADKVTLPGRDGILLVSDGTYAETTVKIDIAVTDMLKLRDVCDWLRGRGALIFSDEPDVQYDAAILNAIQRTQLAKHLSGVKMTVTFTVQPFKTLVNEPAITVTSGMTFQGQGHVDTQPIVTVNGSGTQYIIINGDRIDMDLTSGQPLYIDCDAGVAYTMDGDTMQYAGDKVRVDNDWWRLSPTGATNLVSISSGITSAIIQPHWRFA